MDGMKPKVIMHTQISLDGCIKGFEDTGIYYRLSYQFNADMVLFGSNTVLAAAEFFNPIERETDFVKPIASPNDSRPFAVVPDSRGRLRNLHLFRNMEYIKDVIVLVSHSTPDDYLDYLKKRNYDFIVAGNDHVDYSEALEILNARYGCKTIRTDSGGILTNILLEQCLIDEISLVISPCLVGIKTPGIFNSLDLQDRIQLKLIRSEIVDGDYLSLIYKVSK
jgi:2,5-diamino-6-(ribosylamino)-4(3H)-pyrimidinone 5'-phosphate reductase